MLFPARSIVVLGLLAACAQAPEAIEPVAVSPGAYEGMSCRTVQVEIDQVRDRLEDLEQDQREARDEDTFAVIVLGVPTASLRGKDRAPVIAALKGQEDALDRRIAQCRAGGR